MRLHWCESYRTGNPVLDEQHLTIFLLFNDVMRAIETRASQHMIADTIDSLIYFIRKHFAWEERMMASAGCAEAAAHAAGHARFDAVAQALYQCLGPSDGGETFAGFAREWILDHMAADRMVPVLLAAE